MPHSSECSHPAEARCSEHRPGPADGPFTSFEDHFPDIINPWQSPGYVIPEIDATSFLNSFLPPLKDGITLEDVFSTLEAEGLLDSSGSWTHGTTFWREKEFISLKNIFERSVSIARQNSSALGQTIDLMIPDASLPSQSLQQRSSYFVLRGTEKRVASKHSTNRNTNSWFNVAVPVALRNCGSFDSPKYNTSKLMTSVQMIMARDASRRFLFGITVDNTKVRLWFFSRGTPVVSKAFDMATDVHLLVHVFLSVAFASKEELGWDPTIRPFVGSDGKRAYRIDVDGETYETKDVLADNSAHILVGQGTRVWRVAQRGSDEPLVLKDLWLEDGRELEHATYDAILHDVEKKYGVNVRKEVASHLLTPIVHCLVAVNGEEDHTKKVMMRGYSPPPNSRFSIDVDNIATVKNVDYATIPRSGLSIHDSEDRIFGSPFPRRLAPKKIVHRRHYRIVYKEAATEMYSIRSLPDVFTVLSDSAAVLKWIHGCGWVHRDLSVGNLYWYRGRGLIGDLEYAKRRNFDVEHERRAGTPDFVSVEAFRRQFGYIPETHFDYPLLGSLAWINGTLEELTKMRKTRISCPPFFHHDLHDLESLWWIVVWIFFTFCVTSGLEPTEERSEEQELERRGVYERLFPQDGSVSDRRLFMDSQRFFEQMIHWIPTYHFRIEKLLNTLRGVLLQKYREFESGFPAIELRLFEEVHDVFRIIFAKCKELFRDATLVPYADLAWSHSRERPTPCRVSEEHTSVAYASTERVSRCRLQERKTVPGQSNNLKKRKREENEASSSTRPLCLQRRDLEGFRLRLKAVP